METMELKGVLDGIRAGIANFDSKFNDLQKRMDEFDMQKTAGALYGGSQTGGFEVFRKAFEGSEDLAALMGGRRKSAIVKISNVPLDLKTTITSSAVGSETSGVLRHERVDGVVPLAQRRHFLRDIMPRVPTTAGLIDFVKENAFTNNASPQVEAEAKSESALTFTTDTAPVRTVAHWLPASKQVLDDFNGLMDVIGRKLIFGLLKEEDRQILFGDGTGQNLDGLTHSATAFSTSLLHPSDGWEKVDILRRAMQQVEEADEVGIGWLVLNPRDWADIELQKDSQGRFIAGDPRSVMGPTLWNRPVSVTTAMTAGYFLAGSREAADLRIRQDVTVEVSTEHSDYFVKNMIAIRCEERIALPIYRPAALIYGALNTSPL